MSERPKAVVRRLWQETPKLVGAVLEVPEAVAAGYTLPGQFVVLYPEPESKVFMALASAPGEANALELLIGGPAKDKLGLTEGREIELDPPSGKGFDVELARGKDLLLFAVGSGMSAMRSLVEYIRLHRSDFGRVRLYAGAHTLEEHAYRSYEDAWVADGIELVRAVSQPWVQELFQQDPLPTDNAVAFLCGSKGMVQSTTEVLVAHGLAPELIKLNF